MKKLFLLILVILTSCHKQPPKQTNAIVTYNERLQSIHLMTSVLDKTINEINVNPQYDNFILFIHGRGKHPEKAFNKDLFSDLEKDYSAKVIMFHWPSWEGTYGFPAHKARLAAKDFNTILRQIDGYKSQNQVKVKDIKFTLLTNSMGSIVLEQAMLEKDFSFEGQLFDSVIINAAASRAKNHAKWINRIDFANQIYITINQDDKLLGKLGIRYLGKRLGKGTTTMLGNEITRSPKANYIDVTKHELNHRYYLHRDLLGEPELLDFYNNILNGLLPKPTN